MLLPVLTADVAPVRGVVKQTPDDFRVEEIPAYPPAGQGGHLFVTFEKTGLTTREAVRRIADALGVNERAAGFAGMKDRQAVTVQTASFEGADVERARALSLDGIRVLAAEAHTNKLRTGHLRGNRFRIRVRTEGDPELAAREMGRALARLVREGVPNYFGEQRFGIEGRNEHEARRWLVEGGRAPRDPWKRKMLLSALQGLLFNRVLAMRVEAGTFARALEGDLCKLHATGGEFLVEDVAREQARVDAMEISPTGPMFGAEMRWPGGAVAALERSVMDDAGLRAETLVAVKAAGAGARRLLRVPLQDARLLAEADGVVLSLSLPKGAYATVVLRELMKDGLSMRPDAGGVEGDGSAC